MQEISFTIADAVRRTGISRTALYRLFRQQKLTPRKAGTRILILADELDAFVRSLPAAGTALCRPTAKVDEHQPRSSVGDTE